MSEIPFVKERERREEGEQALSKHVCIVGFVEASIFSVPTPLHVAISDVFVQVEAEKTCLGRLRLSFFFPLHPLRFSVSKSFDLTE